jgi:hypothetical protein
MSVVPISKNRGVVTDDGGTIRVSISPRRNVVLMAFSARVFFSTEDLKVALCSQSLGS